MHRRRFLKTVGLGVAGTALQAAGPEKVTRRPNLLVIHGDQHRVQCLGAYGNREIKTPHLDALAADGVRFTNSFCPYPVCTPSRYSLLSGQYVHEHGGWTNRSTLRPQVPTLPRILRAAGYRTKAVGKMHFTPTYLDVGFDELVLAEQDGPGRWDDDYHRYLMQQGLVDRADLMDQVREYRQRAPRRYWETCGALVSDLPEAHHSTTWTARQAMAALESWTAEAGHLLMVGFVKPHHPFDPPAPWHALYDPEATPLLAGWTPEVPAHDLAMSRGYFANADLTEAQVRRATAYYYATISQIDHHVGRMVALLKARGLYDDTLILYTSDHGEYLGFHHMLLKGNHLYDPLAKVPLIVKWPGGQGAGTVSEAMVNNIDLAPTLCRAAGCEPAPAMRGLDLRAGGPGHEFVFAEAGRWQVMARSSTRKLIRTGPNRPDLFFDLEADPLEMTSRHADPRYRDEIRAMDEALAGWRPRDVDPRQAVTVDENAPQVRGPNVPPRDLSHRPGIIAYYREKMEAAEGAG